MDRRTLVAVGLSFLIFLGWQKFVLDKYQHASPATSDSLRQQSAPVAAQLQSSPATALPSPARTTQSIELDHGSVKIGNGAKIFEGWLHRNPLDAGDEHDWATLTAGLPQLELAVDHGDYSFLGNAVGTLSQKSASDWTWRLENEAVSISRQVSFNSANGFADVTIQAQFKKALPKFAFISLTAPLEAKGAEAQDRKLIYMAGQKVESAAASEPIELTDVLLPAQWIGIEDRYFLLSVVDRSGTSRALLQPLPSTQANRISLVYPVSGNTVTIPARVYFGPKQGELLKAVSPALENAIDFGLLTPVAYVILHFMNWLFSFLKNYGVAIIVLTTVLKILLYPLTFKSMKSMKKMAALQPQLQRLREKYADDKETLNREMLTMMRTNGYNPMAGCLPMLIQMPVFFALYRVLYGSFELYRAPFAFWITDLSAKDPWYVTPVLLTAVMYFQQKLTPSTATDPAQAKMLQWMPVIFGVFMISLPSGLTLYMLTNAVVSVIQQLILNKKLGVSGPNVTA